MGDSRKDKSHKLFAAYPGLFGPDPNAPGEASQAPPPPPAVPKGPMEKLEAIKLHFDTKLFPLCNQFLHFPPKDVKKLEDDYLKATETVIQQVLLKLDAVDAGGDPDVRVKRKGLVDYVQGVLKKMDNELPAGIRPNRHGTMTVD
ncbi:hypothetical protein F4802DRAFT_569971 [Xylaria palmicola]|nr:hypothetical protein F4802DRAFT_569971 [Xylaria palmicola]